MWAQGPNKQKKEKNDVWGVAKRDRVDVDDRLSRARAPWPTRLDASSLRAMRKVRGVTPLLYSLLGEALDRVPCLIEAMGAPLNLCRGERGAVSSVARPPPLSAITPRG